jgi:hypothetical protein
MKKLFNLKQWLTIPDAARHLSILLGEDLSEADVLQLALDGQLTLSVHFLNQVICRIGMVVKTSETALDFDHLLNGNEETFFIIEGTTDGHEVNRIDWSQETIAFDGVWDLSVLGSEKVLEQRYRILTNNPAILAPQSGVVGRPILRGPDGAYYQIAEGFSDPDSGDTKKGPQALPQDSIFVVRTSALRDLEARVSEPDQRVERPLQQRERTTLLVIIAALANLAKIDVTKPAKAGAIIESQTALLGAEVSSRAIQNHLKLIPEALGRRDK